MVSFDSMHWDFALILIFFATAVPLLGRRRVRQLMQMPETTKQRSAYALCLHDGVSVARDGRNSLAHATLTESSLPVSGSPSQIPRSP